ncbi:ABC transporter substrate-binding protein [Actinomyces mediterranea]|uniref:ABC transporter substrate-binding protein n=1 Tax=Actinomyces mediterranea TaxID=1871028 RepID=UPI0009711A80|nr:ABC transporter substrate-binding protein [Actinomyces mediterranea]
MRTTRVGIAIALAMSTAMALSGCGGSDQTSSASSGGASPGTAGNRVVLISRQDPGSLDYTKSLQTALLNWIPGNVVEPLLSKDDNGEVGPGLADFEVNPERTEYTFTIGDNSFSDGSKITASDVVFSLNTMKESPIANWASAYTQVSSIEELDENRVKVTLKQPSQAFIQGMTSVPGLIQPEAAFDGIATNPIGSGPYVLAEYVQNSRILLKANPHYAGEKPAIEEAEIRIITDGAAALNALKSGEADGMPLIQNDMWEQLKNQRLDEQMTLLQNPAMGEKQYLVLNANGENTKDREVRRAIASAIDRSALVAAVNADWAMVPTCDYGLETDPWVKRADSQTCPVPEDANLAKQLAEKLDLGARASHFVSLSDVPDLSLPADVLIEQFKTAGITVDREPIDLARYSQTIFQGRPPQFEVTNMSDPAGITQFTCADADSAGWTTYCSSEFTDLIVKADAAADAQEYNDLLGQANDILKNDMVIVPLTYTYGIGLAKPDLKNAGAASVVFKEIPLYEMSW